MSGWGVLELKGRKPLAIYKKAEEFIKTGEYASFFHTSMGTHMMEVTLERHLYKMGCPGMLTGAVTPEEFGATISGGELSVEPGVLPSNTSEGTGGIALGRDQRLGLVQQLRLAFEKLGVNRNAARWARIESIIERKITSRDLLTLDDGELMKAHDEMTAEAKGKDAPLIPEIVAAEDGTAGGEGPKVAADDPDAVKCDDCRKAVDPGWLKILRKYSATKNRCSNCYYLAEKTPEPAAAGG